MQLLDGNKAFHLHINRILVNDGNSSYMSPEYAMDGLFSKIQCFSFGIMMLEIISGKKNSGFYQLNCSSNLAGYVSDYDKALFMLLFCL